MTEKEWAQAWSLLNQRIGALEWGMAWLLTRNEGTAFFTGCVDMVEQDHIHGAGWGDNDVEQFRQSFDEIRGIMAYFTLTEADPSTPKFKAPKGGI